METMKLAVPTMGNASLESQRSDHFGHCDCFSIVEIRDGEIFGIEELANPAHEENGCHRPVALLQDAGIDAIVAFGMGSRPMDGFGRAGITVYHDTDAATVGEVAKKIAKGEARVMSPENACHH